MGNKFKIGQEVVVVKLDEQFAKEPYDMIGYEYSCTHFKTGKITGIKNNKYAVLFDKNITVYEEFYYYEDELMCLFEFNKADKNTLDILYGRKEV